MTEDNDESRVKHPRAGLPFVEVICKSSGKIRRFSAGTDAGFAVGLINQKLVDNGDVGNILLASHIEAVKGEEEPVSFGPNSVLVNYCSDWKLQSVVHSYGYNGAQLGRVGVQKDYSKMSGDTHSSEIAMQSPISLAYVGKILLALVLIFSFGAAFTLLLDNLPQFIVYVNSYI